MHNNRPHIAGLVLYVRDPDGLAEFYCDVLGMSRQSSGDDVAVGYGGQGAALILRRSTTGAAYDAGPSDRYWKIAITLPDLDMAQAQLSQRGITATAPHQFQQIAYMSHLTDPEGHVIELLQHTFEGAPKTAIGDPDAPLGGGAQLGLITLRTADIAADMAVCQDALGMTYLSRQSVSDRGFDLYFLALTQERPPDADVDAVANREWLWQRPYTTLEFQHLLGGGEAARVETDGAEVVIAMGDGRQRIFR